MNVTDRFRLAIAEGEPLDWDSLRNELDAEHITAESTRERENLLALFTVMADMVERIDTTAVTIASFLDERRQSYHRLLLREAWRDGSLCAKSLNEVTEREVVKGRMLQDDPMRLAAIIGFSGLAQVVDTASNAQPGLAVRPADAAESLGGAWQGWLSSMVSLAQRRVAMWRWNRRSGRFDGARLSD